MKLQNLLDQFMGGSAGSTGGATRGIGDALDPRRPGLQGLQQLAAKRQRSNGRN